MQWRKWTKTLVFWVLLFLAAVWFVQIFNLHKSKEVEVTFSEYKQFLNNDAIEKATIQEQEFHGVLKYEETLIQNGNSITFRNFKTILPFIDSEMVDHWQEIGMQFEFKEKSAEWLGYLFNMLPFFFIILLYLFFMRRLQGGGGAKGIFSFGKSRARLLSENRAKVTFKDVAGADEAKQELSEIIEFLKAPEKFQMLGGRIPKGVLLLGPPGTGKTLLGRAVAGEAGVPFFSISGADFVEMFVGVGASRVRDLFEQGKKSAPCIIFIDEIDAVGRHRGAGLGGGHDEREQTLNQLLVEMDGFESNEGVILLAATNRPDVLDQALLRPGRFDRQVVVDRPDVRGREGILKVHTRKIPLAKNVNLSVLAKGTPGFSGADLANLVNESALLAARRNKKHVEMIDLEESKDKVMMGVERKSMIINEEEKISTAYHESGHVLVSKLIPGSDPVHKVTIIPRGRALGVTSFLPIDEKHNYTIDYCKALLTHLLGGRAAESIVLKQLSTGAGNDIERATELARKMVCEWGMSEKLGPITFGKKSEEIFLGREIAQHRDYSETTAILIDQEVRRIVEEAYQRANTLLKKNVKTLHRMAEALLEREILDGDEIDLIIAGKPLTPKENQKKKQTKQEKQKTKSRTKRKIKIQS
ncbi:ATP-dependent zinc metalloprotease FtsH [bacterium]|nr:ATP-dependent zinc metalloprotease FtsH [bacterium]RQV98688.1 MAG: ATP-dependent metallopeptidase FtsH/Yme1/Tma family protein [bacterium]